MKIIFCILILSFIMTAFTACYKGHSGLVEGDVFYQSSGLPISNANITIGEDHNANTEFSIGQTTTDNNGHFKLYFNKHIYKSYRQFLHVNKDSLEVIKKLAKNKSKVTIFL